MPPDQKQKIINTIIKNEKLRPLSRFNRLLKDPIHAFPYYILAILSHIKPFKLSFKTLWGDILNGYLPECNTFYYYGYCEANLTSFLLRFLKEGSTFIDVGAHIGFYSVLTSHLVGKSGKVYSFEPTPWTYKLLQRNTSILQNVNIVNSGASDSSGKISFSDYGPGYGAYNTGDGESAIIKSKPQKITAKTSRLDEYFKQNSIIPNFIKLDTEGFEGKILIGLSETLKTSRPLITLEMAGDKKWSENCKKSSDILFASDYVSYKMFDNGFIERCEIELSYTYTNILFVPKEKIDSVLYLIKS